MANTRRRYFYGQANVTISSGNVSCFSSCKRYSKNWLPDDLCQAMWDTVIKDSVCINSFSGEQRDCGYARYAETGNDASDNSTFHYYEFVHDEMSYGEGQSSDDYISCMKELLKNVRGKQ